MKKSISLSLSFCLLTICLTTTACADDPVTKGKAALAKGDVRGAITLFKEALRKDKNNAEAYQWLGAAYLKADSLDQAVAALVQAREYGPENPKIYELLGDVYLEQKINAAAVDQYNKAAELDKKNSELLLKIAETNRKSRQYNQAAEAYIKVLLIDSTNVTALRELGTIYMRAKQFQNAISLFRDLTRLEPDSLEYQINYIKMLNETKYYKDLIPYAENVLKNDSTQSEIAGILRDAYVETGNYDGAEKLFSDSNVDSLSADELIKRGKGLKALEKFDEAISSFELAYGKDSTLSDMYYDLATLYNKKERYADAVRMFDKKIESDTSANYRWASYFQAAQSLANLKDFKKAKDYIIKSFDYKPDYVSAWEMLAQYNGSLNLTAEQISAYRKVIELAVKADTNGNGGNGKYKNSLDAAYRNLGYLLYNGDKYQESIDYYKKAYQLNPKDCQLIFTIGQIYQVKIKNEEEAQKYYCKVLQLCPKSENAKNATTYLKMMGLDCD